MLPLGLARHLTSRDRERCASSIKIWCDNTGESLALKLRAGSAGSNTVADHLEVLDEAITQVPARYRRDLLITVDGAGASHGLVDHITMLNSRPDLGEAGIVELTALLREHPNGDQLASWPADLRIFCRREKPHPGAQLSLFEAHDGWRYQLTATNTATHTAQFLEARHRPHARVEDNVLLQES